MSDERLSDEMLVKLRWLAIDGSGTASPYVSLLCSELLAIVDELRTLRAAMPTAEEREALIELADEVRSLFREQPQAELALTALDKLTKEKP